MPSLIDSTCAGVTISAQTFSSPICSKAFFTFA